MSDQQTPTPIDMLVDRLSQRIGQLTAENEWLRVQLELMQAKQPESDVDPTMNGERIVEEAESPLP